MRRWNVQRIATFSDEELASALDKIEADITCKVKEIIYIGENPLKVRIYQIIYTKEY